MFVVLLRFSENKGKAGDHMDGHKAWLKSGFDDGVFLLAGSLPPGLGGAIVAGNVDPGDLEDRISRDPFVAEGVVETEIVEISANMADARLEFLKP